MTTSRFLIGVVIIIMVAVAATPGGAANSRKRNSTSGSLGPNAYLSNKRVNAPLAACTWTGATDTDWANAANWTGCTGGGAPLAGDSVTIGSGGNQPTLTTATPLLSTVFINGADLKVSTNGVLNTNGDLSLVGTLEILGGTVNLTGDDINLLYSNSATLTITGGALNIGGRLSPGSSAPTDTINYQQSGGTVTVATFASTNVSFGTFFITPASVFMMSSGTIVFAKVNTNVRDCRIFAPDGGVTGGTIQFGDATTQNLAHFGIDSTPQLFNLTVFDPTNNVATLNVHTDVTVNHTLTLSGGNIISIQSATLIIGSSGTAITRTNGSFVICALRKNGLSSGFTFHVGSASDAAGLFPIGYTPVDVTDVSGGGDLTVKTTAGPEPSVNASTSLQEYWILTQNGPVTASLTFTYLQGDVRGTEANYRVIRVSGGTPVSFPTTVLDTVNNTATIAGVSSFSDWTLGETTAPTAAPARISGQILNGEGQPVSGVTLTVSGGATLIRAITDSNGFYKVDNLAAGDFYTVTPSRANYTFAPANRAFSLVADKTDAVFTGLAVSPIANPLDSPEFFVRQQYLDFLGREPDQGGLDYWSMQLRACGADLNCARTQKIGVSAAFFMSDEFQQGANYIYRLYRASLGRQLTYAEFTDDHKKVIGGADLESSRTQFAEDFVQRPEFLEKYRNTSAAETFVDALLQGMLVDTQVDLSSQREALIATYNSGGDINHGRSAVLRAVAERTEFKTAVYNPSFVLMEYFGYLRRDMDQSGFDFWVNVLNNRDPGNYRGMVCSFITSTEYQSRFSSVVTRNNAECGP